MVSPSSGEHDDQEFSTVENAKSAFLLLDF